MRKIIKYFLYTLFIPFWWLQKLIPRNRNIWIFGAWYGLKYSDNAKVLFEYVSEHNLEIKPIWLTKSKNIVTQLKSAKKNVFLANSFKGIFYSLIAGKVIFSSGKVDINKFFINGAKTVNVWHGAPIKKIGLDDLFANLSKYKKIIFKYLYPFVWEFNIDYVVSTAEIFNDKLSSAFNVPVKNIIPSGYPRCDLLFNLKLNQLTLNFNLKFNKPKIILYLPTFRSGNAKFLPFNNFEFDEKAWDYYLNKSNSLLISKGHFVDKTVGALTNIERVIHISDDDIPELNDFLKDVDILITDYSGVYFDFLLTDKPIILAPFDLQNYILKSRELYFKYDEIVCGYRANNWKQILELLNSNIDLIPDNKYFKIKKLFNTYNHGNSSSELMNYIYNI